MALTIGTSAPLHRSFFTAVDFACDDFPWGEDLFAVLRAAVRWSGTSLAKGFLCHPWDLSFYIHFSTTVLTVQTGYLFCTVFAIIPALKRGTCEAFQGITWKKETNTKIELIAWISKANTPNYPIVTIQYFCFSTRKPFGIKWILNLCHHLFSSDKLSRRKTREMLDKLDEEWHNSISSSLLKESGNISATTTTISFICMTITKY